MRLVDEIRGAKLLLAASTGGHLAQLDKLAATFEPHPDSLWVTFDKPQSRSLLAGRRHLFVPYIAPRDIANAAKASRVFRQLLREESFDAVISTGAAIAVASHVPAVLARSKPIYIESVSRFDGPSLSGRIMHAVPGIRTYSQHEGYGRGWTTEFSVLDAYPRPTVRPDAEPPRRILVTLGTIHPYRFDSLIDAVLTAAPGADITWQLGSTERSDLPGKVANEMSAEEFDAEVAASDLVITHAGVGTIMGLLDARAATLIVPRRSRRDEHVDDHQEQIAREIAKRGLGTVAESEEIDAAILRSAAGVTW